MVEEKGAIAVYVGGHWNGIAVADELLGRETIHLCGQTCADVFVYHRDVVSGNYHLAGPEAGGLPEAADLEFAESHPSLGPFYRVADRVVSRAMGHFLEGDARPLVDSVVKAIQDKLWDSVQSSLWSDVEMNLQHQFYHGVDGAVKALLTGQRWALERYVLLDRHDMPAIRAAVSAHIPEELRDARVRDLEARVRDLEETIERLRR